MVLIIKLSNLQITRCRKVYNDLVNHYAKGDVLDVGKSIHWKYNNFLTLDINTELNPTIVGDIQYAPFKNNSFDTVLCNGMYENVDNPQLMINEVLRITKHYAIFGFVGKNYKPYKKSWKYYEGKEEFPVAVKKTINLDEEYYFIICEKLLL